MKTSHRHLTALQQRELGTHREKGRFHHSPPGATRLYRGWVEVSLFTAATLGTPGLWRGQNHDPTLYSDALCRCVVLRAVERGQFVAFGRVPSVLGSSAGRCRRAARAAPISPPVRARCRSRYRAPTMPPTVRLCARSALSVPQWWRFDSPRAPRKFRGWLPGAWRRYFRYGLLRRGRLVLALGKFGRIKRRPGLSRL